MDRTTGDVFYFHIYVKESPDGSISSTSAGSAVSASSSPNYAYPTLALYSNNALFMYVDTSTGEIYISYDSTAGDWSYDIKEIAFPLNSSKKESHPWLDTWWSLVGFNIVGGFALVYSVNDTLYYVTNTDPSNPTDPATWGSPVEVSDGSINVKGSWNRPKLDISFYFFSGNYAVVVWGSGSLIMGDASFYTDIKESDIGDIALNSWLKISYSNKGAVLQGMLGEPVTLKFYDVSGRKFLETKAGKGALKMSLPQRKGIYFIKAETNKGKIVKTLKVINP